MITGPQIAEIAALVGEPARATMLSALLDGRALTAAELAFAARVTPQTASTHLAKLSEAGLLSPVREGRHRYFRLASAKVVDMLDGIIAVALDNRPRYRPLSRQARELSAARICYDRCFDLGWTERMKHSRAVIVTAPGQRGFAETFGIDTAEHMRTAWEPNSEGRSSRLAVSSP